VIAALAVLLGAMLQSATGFGFALAAAPLLVAIIGPRATVSTIVVLALVVALLTLVAERRRPQFDHRETVALIGWSLPGLLAGVVVLRLVPERGLAVLVLVAVIATVLLRVRTPARVRPWSPARAAATGVTSGVLSTSTGVGGPPIVFHLLARRFSPETMRDTLMVVWVAGGLLTGGVLLVTGSVQLPDEMPLLVAAAVAGQLVGRRVFALLHGDRYERAVLAVLLVTALVALGMRIGG
jgi:uncharacterized protein